MSAVRDDSGIFDFAEATADAIISATNDARAGSEDTINLPVPVLVNLAKAYLELVALMGDLLERQELDD